jgi:hypothetical protein
MFEKMNKVLGLLVVVIVVLVGCSAFPLEKDNVWVIASPDKSLEESTIISVPTANSEILMEEPTITYIPTVMKNYPTKNIMGAQLAEINDKKGLSLMLDANSVWTRLDYNWSLVEPMEGVVYWSRANLIDQQLINAATNQMEVLLILGDTPIWARFTNWPCGGKINPGLYESFSNFIFEFIKRYSNSPFNIKYFELWNEPDAADFLGCWGDPNDINYYGGQAYGEMLKIAYQSAKSANPNAEILIGGLLLDCDPALGLKNEDGSLKDCRSANFLKGILAAGAGNSFDGVAFHAYDYYDALSGGLGIYSNANFNAKWDTTGPVTLEKSKFIRRTLQDYGITNRYLMNTEAGLLCAACSPSDKNMQITKAYYVAQEFAAAIADGYLSNIWYSVYGDRNSGLMAEDNQPYPAYYTFSFASQAMENHNFVRILNLDPNVKGYEFISSSGKIQWVLWSIDGKNHTIPLMSMPASIHKIADSGQGNEVSPSTSVIVGIAPVFIKY